MMSVGPESMKTPLSLGNEGHYISLYLQAHELNTTGTLYILDSIKRNINAVERDGKYAVRTYPFVGTSANAARTGFAANYDVTRMNDTVLRLDQTREVRQRLQELPVQQALQQHGKLFSSMKLFGLGFLFIRLQ